MTELCALCGDPMPKPSWWQRLTRGPYPTHNPKGAEGDACWRAMNARMGRPDPGPRPQ